MNETARMPKKPDIIPRIRPWLSVPYRDMVIEVVRRIGPARIDAIADEIASYRGGKWSLTTRGYITHTRASTRLHNLLLAMADSGHLSINVKDGEIYYCIPLA